MGVCANDVQKIYVKKKATLINNQGAKGEYNEKFCFPQVD